MMILKSLGSLSYLCFEFTCVGLTVAFIVFCCIPLLHDSARAFIRPWAIYHVENGLYWVALAQKMQSPILTVLFEQSSSSVSVGFYGSFLPALLWLGLPEMGWHLVILMTITLYVGNAMKDLVSSPRPLGLQYGDVRLSHLCTSTEEAKKNSEEYGLPSSHTMNSLCLNFYMCHYLHEKEIFSNDMAILTYSSVTLWVVWIALSRIYLGLHTPIDILAGAVAGLTVLTAFISCEEYINMFVSLPYDYLAFLLIAVVLLRLHPKPADHTPSFEFSTSFVGVCFGVLAGIKYIPEFYQQQVQIYDIWSRGYLFVTRRLFVGYIIVLVAKIFFRRLSTLAFPILYRAFPLEIRKLWQPPVHDRCHEPDRKDKCLQKLPHTHCGLPADIDATTRFFSYAGIGLGACFVAPFVFVHAGF